jgi:inner membrane protein
VRPAVRTRLSVLWPVAALAAIVGLDLVRSTRDWPLPVLGLLDEPAHVLTAGLALAAFMAVKAPGSAFVAIKAGNGRRSAGRRFAGWVLAGAVLLDLDHVPLFLGLDVAATPGGRPVTHSLLTVALLLVAGAVARRWRIPLLGLAVGAATQLVRDLSTGPGVPLLWPLVPDDVRLPYAPYLVLLVVLAAGAAVRRLSGRAAGAAAER